MNTWDLSVEAIWPIMQMFLAPFGDIIQTGAAILIGTLIFGALVRWLRS